MVFYIVGLVLFSLTFSIIWNWNFNSFSSLTHNHIHIGIGIKKVRSQRWLICPSINPNYTYIHSLFSQSYQSINQIKSIFLWERERERKKESNSRQREKIVEKLKLCHLQLLLLFHRTTTTTTTTTSLLPPRRSVMSNATFAKLSSR